MQDNGRKEKQIKGMEGSEDKRLEGILERKASRLTEIVGKGNKRNRMVGNEKGREMEGKRMEGKGREGKLWQGWARQDDRSFVELALLIKNLSKGETTRLLTEHLLYCVLFYCFVVAPYCSVLRCFLEEERLTSVSNVAHF